MDHFCGFARLAPFEKARSFAVKARRRAVVIDEGALLKLLHYLIEGSARWDSSSMKCLFLGER
jgi:hypothetical protein